MGEAVKRRVPGVLACDPGQGAEDYALGWYRGRGSSPVHDSIDLKAVKRLGF